MAETFTKMQRTAASKMMATKTKQETNWQTRNSSIVQSQTDATILNSIEVSKEKAGRLPPLTRPVSGVKGGKESPVKLGQPKMSPRDKLNQEIQSIIQQADEFLGYPAMSNRDNNSRNSNRSGSRKSTKAP
jgi:hypothetical protein